MSHSSSGLGRCVLSAETPVQIRYGVPVIAPSSSDLGHVGFHPSDAGLNPVGATILVNGSEAQLDEQSPTKRKVVGSNPTRASKIAGIAQG